MFLVSLAGYGWTIARASLSNSRMLALQAPWIADPLAFWQSSIAAQGAFGGGSRDRFAPA
jgi:hypothetical protein